MREKTIGGVCAGFARYLDVDVTLMRIIWLCVAVFTGIGFIAYVICWIVMPEDWSAPEHASEAESEGKGPAPPVPAAESPEEQTGSSPA